MKYCALIPAAGYGARMQQSIPKQYLPLHHHPILWYTINRLASHPLISSVALILSEEDTYFTWHDYEDIPNIAKLQVYFCGGKSRAETVKNGLQSIKYSMEPDNWVLVHDAARPCLSITLLNRLIDTVSEDKVGGILALPVADTLKAADAQQCIQHTVSRTSLWMAQTPQMFRYQLLCKALAHTQDVTDEASALEAQGYTPRLVQGHLSNLKVTYPGDLQLAEAILALKENQCG